jgi:hypothetical protein
MCLEIIKPGVMPSTGIIPHSLAHVQELQYDKMLPAIKFSDVGYTEYHKMNFIYSREKLNCPV